MPPAGYLTASSIESCLQYLASTYPGICQLIVLPETSRDGRTCRAVRIGNGASAERDGVLFIGGVHAREIVNPDLLVTFALRLCNAYTTSSGLTFGSKSYTSGVVKLLVDALDVFIFPLVNPDGREYVQSPTGNPWWRKNRSLNGGGAACVGVDLNRNYDFLFSSGIGTSGSTCSDVFKGPSAFSEPETRNVRHMLDTYPHVHCMFDVHSHGELILHPWGDDDTQTTNLAQNFQNPAFNGLRGVTGDMVYREYMASADKAKFVSLGNRVRDGIAEVRGHVFDVEPAVDLYPTSGTSKDYGYARHLVDASKRKVFAYTIETAGEFQPPYSEALEVMSEVSVGLMEFCLGCLCSVEEAMSTVTDATAQLERLRVFRDAVLRLTPKGRASIDLLERHSVELIQIMRAEPPLRKRAEDAITKLSALLAPSAARKTGKTRKKAEALRLPSSLVRSLDQLMRDMQRKASQPLAKALVQVRSDIGALSKRSLDDLLN